METIKPSTKEQTPDTKSVASPMPKSAVVDSKSATASSDKSEIHSVEMSSSAAAPPPTDHGTQPFTQDIRSGKEIVYFCFSLPLGSDICMPLAL